MIRLDMNGRCRQVDAVPHTPLLGLLHAPPHRTGSKSGCRLAQG